MHFHSKRFNLTLVHTQFSIFKFSSPKYFGDVCTIFIIGWPRIILHNDFIGDCSAEGKFNLNACVYAHDLNADA